MNKSRRPQAAEGQMPPATLDSAVKPRKTKLSLGPALLVPAGILLVYALFCVYKLFDLSINKHRYYTERAAYQHVRRQVQYPERGSILDSDGNILAGTTYIYTIGITPRDVRAIKDPKKEMSTEVIADRVAEILSLDRDGLLANLKKVDQTYIQLIKGVDRDTRDQLKEYLDKYLIGGFAIDPVMKRYYPENDYLSPVIGFATNDGSGLKGRYGVELSYDDDLRGEVGYSYSEVDNYRQSQLPNARSVRIGTRDGNDVILTINKDIQETVQDVVVWLNDATAAEYGAFACVMDPATGEILAMAGSNTFDLNHPSDVPRGKNPNVWDPDGNKEDNNYLQGEVWRNKVITQSYEPGSIMKPFTLAIAFDEGQVSLDEYLSDAPLQMGDWKAYKMGCWAQRYGYNHGEETIQEALQRSCNPPFAILAQRVGIEYFYDHLKRLGFTSLTGIDLPSESVGLLHSDPSVTDLCTMAIGEQSTVSPIRLITSYAAMANGGSILQPHVVKRIQTREGDVVKEFGTQVLRRVFSENITRQVRKMMVPGTHLPDGSGPKIYSPGLLTGAKTGTSEDNTDISKVCYSVAALTPYDEPQFVVLASIQVPRADTDSRILQTGVRTILKKCAEYKKLKPRFDDYDLYRTFTNAAAINYAGYTYFQAVSDGCMNRDVRVVAPWGAKSNEHITDQYPNSSEALAPDSIIYVGTTEHPMPKAWFEKVEVPDFTGLNYFEAQWLAARSDLNISMSGYDANSVVSYQSIAPVAADGTVNRVRKRSVIDLVFDGQAEAVPDVGVGVDIWQPAPSPIPSESAVNESQIDADAWNRFDQGLSSERAEAPTETAGLPPESIEIPELPATE